MQRCFSPPLCRLSYSFSPSKWFTRLLQMIASLRHRSHALPRLSLLTQVYTKRIWKLLQGFEGRDVVGDGFHVLCVLYHFLAFSRLSSEVMIRGRRLDGQARFRS